MYTIFDTFDLSPFTLIFTFNLLSASVSLFPLHPPLSTSGVVPGSELSDGAY